MVDRRHLLAGVGALALIAGLRALWSTDVEAAGNFEIQKSDSEWRAILPKAQYDVLRRHRTEPAGARPRACAVLVGDQIRQQDRLAELLSAAAGRSGHRHRLPVATAAHRGALPAVRRTFGPCLRGWTAAHGIALLYQRRSLEIFARRARLTVALRSDARVSPSHSRPAARA
jgi:hypothetical protein